MFEHEINELLVLSGSEKIYPDNLLVTLKEIFEGMMQDINKLQSFNKILNESIISKNAKFKDEIFSYGDKIRNIIKSIDLVIKDCNIKHIDYKKDKRFNQIFNEFVGYEDFIRYLSMLYFIAPRASSVKWETTKYKLKYTYLITPTIFYENLPAYLVKATDILENHYESIGANFDLTLTHTVEVSWKFNKVVSTQIKNIEENFFVIFIDTMGEKTLLQQFIEMQFIDSKAMNNDIYKTLKCWFNYIKKHN